MRNEEFTLVEFLDALERKLDSSLQLFSWQQSFFGPSDHSNQEFADSLAARETPWTCLGQSEVDLYLWDLLISENSD